MHEMGFRTVRITLDMLGLKGRYRLKTLHNLVDEAITFYRL